MTLPNEILDSLLSGYLDDALTADERTRVEQLLESDADARSDLESMRELRDILSHIDRTDRPKAVALIRPSFSEQIIDAAIECARNEGVSEDHPLLRTTEAPSYRRDQSKRGKRLAVVVAALAASGLIGAIVFGPEWSKTTPNQIVQQTNSSQSLGRFERSSVDLDSIQANRIEASLADAGAMGSGNARVEAMGIERPDSVIQDRVASSTPITESPNATSNDGVAKPFNVDASQVGKQPMEASIANLALPTPVLVFDVRVSELGRIADPIRVAMDAVGISPASQKAVNESMVSSVTDAVRSLESASRLNKDAVPTDISGKLIYIEASAKKIDQLMNALWADREGIDSFGFNMTMETPLTHVVESLSSIRATDIQHSQTIEFNGDLEAVARPLANYLGNRSFDAPKGQRSLPAATELDPTKDGRNEDANDFMGRVFLIIR